MHEKARIFEEGNSIYYPLIFERRAKLHAHSFGYERSSAALDEYFDDQAPPASGLLFAFLLHQCAKTLTPSNQVHRQNMEKDLGFADGMTKEERDSKLLEDPKYPVDLIKNTSSFIYVELVSYILFKIFGDKIYSKFDELLLKTEVCEVYQNANYEKIERELSQKKFGANSFVGMTWSMFSDLIEGLVRDASWYNNYV